MKHLAKESIIGQNRDERIICFSNSAADFQRLSTEESRLRLDSRTLSVFLPIQVRSNS